MGSDILARVNLFGNVLSASQALHSENMANIHGPGKQQRSFAKQNTIFMPSLPIGLKRLLIPTSVRSSIYACQTENDWDDEGAIGVTREACAMAYQFLEDVLERDARLPIPRVSPSVFGAVTFQWRNDEEHLVLRVLPGSEAVSYHIEKIGVFRKIGEESRSAAVQRVLNLFKSHAPSN